MSRTPEQNNFQNSKNKSLALTCLIYGYVAGILSTITCGDKKEMEIMPNRITVIAGEPKQNLQNNSISIDEVLEREDLIEIAKDSIEKYAYLYNASTPIEWHEGRYIFALDENGIEIIYIHPTGPDTKTGKYISLDFKTGIYLSENTDSFNELGGSHTLTTESLSELMCALDACQETHKQKTVSL